MKYVLSGNKLLSILVSSDGVVYEIRQRCMCWRGFESCEPCFGPQMSDKPSCETEGNQGHSK